MMPGKWKNSSIHFTIFYPALFIFPKAPNCQNSKKCYFIIIIIITIIITTTTNTTTTITTTITTTTTTATGTWGSVVVKALRY